MQKVILLGDLHFGIKQFSSLFLQNQIAFFKNQLFPYMLENDIDTIYQLGDFFDNRTSVDINFLNEIKRDFFELLKDHNFKIHSLVGNHDIFYRQSREVTLIERFSDIYSENFSIYKERTLKNICGKKCLIVPWITKSETLTFEEIKKCQNILGHFEIANFEMVKGHLSNAHLTSEFFSKGTKVQNVFSGHFHIKNSNGFINYLGTPFQLNWGDYNLENGFYVWDGDNLDFVANTESFKHVKLKYNDTKEYPLEIKGLYKNSIYCDLDTFKEILSDLSRHEIKFFVNEASDRKFDEFIHELKKVKPSFTIIDNQSISLLLSEAVDGYRVSRPSTKQIITEEVLKSRPDLEPLLMEIFQEVESISDNN
jgi:DNA repair exonuclease SbcCD nuclease subunit